MIPIQLGKKENTEVHDNLSIALRAVVAARGSDILSSADELSEELTKKQIPYNIIMQLILFLKTSNISHYYNQARTGITMIDVNNIVSCSYAQTGLTKQKIKYLLTAVLYALGLSTDIGVVSIPSENAKATSEVVILSPKSYEQKLTEIGKAVKNKDEAKLQAFSTELDSFVKAGIPEAMYLKGMCYMNGIATTQDWATAYKFLSVAADMGHAEANAVLGDYYFNDARNNNYTKAYEYYTQLGAVALSEERKDNLKTILASVEQNIKQFVLSAILLIIMFIFNAKMGNGAFDASGDKHWVAAVISDILLCGIYGMSLLVYLLQKYNKTKWVTVMMFAVFAIIAFIALV